MAEKCGACGSYNTEYLYHLGVLSVRCEDCGADLLPGVVIQDKEGDQ